MKTIAFAFAAAALIAAPAFADEHSEIVQAATHASLAGKASDIAMVHAHMHHALNCLVGPKGDGFDATAMNPCANAGNGAIPDSTNAKAKASLEKAAGDLRTGIAETDLAKAQKSGADIGDALAKAE
jgi:hypothetical protein